MNLERIPFDTVFVVFEFLSLSDIIRICSVSKRNWEISKLARSDKYWGKRYNDLVRDKYPLEKLNSDQLKAHKRAKNIYGRYRIVKISYTISKAQKPPLNELRDIKVILVGDGGVGKTSLLIRYFNNKFTTKHLPTIFDNKVAKVRYRYRNNDQPVGLNLWDTSGKENYDALRPLIYFYQQTDVFIFCFDISNSRSFDNITTKWNEEIVRCGKDYVGDTYRIILCGLKSDLREDHETIQNMKDRNTTFVSLEEALEVKNNIKAVKYIETSSKNRKNIDELFYEALDCMFLEKEVPNFFSKKKKGNKIGDIGDSKCFVM